MILGDVYKMNVGVRRVALATLAVVFFLMAGLTVYDYMSPADSAYFAARARAYAASCLTDRKCTTVDRDGNEILVAPPLSPMSPCAAPEGLRLLKSEINAHSGYAYVLLQCADGAGYLVQYVSTGKYKGGTGNWFKCLSRSCASDVRRLPSAF